MTFLTRLRVAAVTAICAAACAGTALAQGPQALSHADAKRYAEAFEAADQGDFVGAQIQSVEIQDKSLLGHLSFRQLMHPTAHKASFQELAAWLSSYRDLPVADRVFSLAQRRKPAGALDPTAPVIGGTAWSQVEAGARGLSNPPRAGRPRPERGRAAREAFYAGDVKRALALATAADEHWIAGLSAYRLKDYGAAESHFLKVAGDEAEDPWLRAGAGYWASRAAGAAGDSAKATANLAAAARFPNTFYGMIAARGTKLAAGVRPQPAQAAREGQVTPAAFTGPTIELTRFVRSEPRAHRAAALAQIDRPLEAGLELRAGLTLAKDAAERSLWTSLILALNAPISAAAEAQAAYRTVADYPTPALEPRSGFTVDKALVYAIVRQESRFNPMAVSPSGAVGLMQLMPAAAARAAGDDKLLADNSPLFDPAFNLRVGQDYVTWLMERGVGYDILRTVAAYNGGPGTLLKTAAQLGEEADSLMIIECLPALETRNYVEKVMAGYWTYRAKFGLASPTLDALAKGDKFIDARLDRAGAGTP